MKYKLINKQTGEEHLCDKVTIDGFDYYVNDEEVPSDNYFTDGVQIVKNDLKINLPKTDNPFFQDCKKVIATNNPNIDVPKVVDEVKKNLYFDKQVMNPYETGGQSYTAYEKGFIQGYNKSQETHPNSDDDMVDFSEWLARNYYNLTIPREGKLWVDDPRNPIAYSTEEMLALWKEQQLKIVYYE